MLTQNRKERIFPEEIRFFIVERKYVKKGKKKNRKKN
jgi:hypothetical protein